MKKSKEYKTLQAIALREKVSLQDVRREIEIAIEIGMSDSNPNVQKMWREISPKGEKPTPEELIHHLSSKVSN